MASNTSSSRILVDQRLERNLSVLRKYMPQFTRDAVNESALSIQAAAKKNITDSAAVDTGQLRASIKIESFKDGFARRVGSDVKHAPFIEFGTGPRKKFPPLEPIRRWCRRHRIPESAAFAIARAIKMRGTPARPFLYPAYEQERPQFIARMRRAYSQFRKQIV